jgi:hypothetical protein
MKVEPTAVVVAFLGVAGSIAAAWITAGNKAETKAQEVATTAANKAETKAGEVATAKAQQVVDLNSVKLCSIVKPDMWRDNILVPNTWKAETCKRFSEQMGAWNYELGCVYNDEIAMGARNSGTGPMRNCGW